MMFSILAKRYVEEKLCHEYFKEYCDIVEQHNHKLEFRKREHDEDSLNGDFGIIRKGYIIASPEWAVRLILNKDDIVLSTAFKITLGHELGHTYRRHPTIALTLKHIRFICHVNEVFADFWSAKHIANAERQLLLQSMRYKYSNKKPLQKCEFYDKMDKIFSFYPSWLQRMEYAERFDFNKVLIHKIAEDVGCPNSFIEKKITKYYEGWDIDLVPPIQISTGDTN